MREYSALGLITLPPAARVALPPAPPRVTLDDPAPAVMTDLRAVPAATTTPEETVDRAHAFMIRRGVRLLFVLDAAGLVAGVLTATDLLGEKPMRFMQARGVPHAEIRVGDVMTPAAVLQAVPLQEVMSMRVGHVVETLRAVGRQHLMVAEGPRICGIISATQVARQLGIQLQTFEVAGTFADIEAALARS